MGEHKSESFDGTGFAVEEALEALSTVWATEREGVAAQMADVDAAVREPKISSLFVATAMTFGMAINRHDATVCAGAETLPMAGTHARLSIGTVHQRPAHTHVTFTNPFAFAPKKNSGNSCLIFTAADGHHTVTQVDPKRTAAAMRFVAQFNALSERLVACQAALIW